MTCVNGYIEENYPPPRVGVRGEMAELFICERLDRFAATLAGADAHGVFQRQDKDLAVAD